MAMILNPYVENRRIYSGDDWENDDDVLAHAGEMTLNERGGLSDEREHEFTHIRMNAGVIKKRKKIPDWHTHNESFLKLHSTLSKIGIQNNKFFLAIYDRDLIGVEVYSPYVAKTPEIQLKIFLECIVNPWYFLREVCRIPVDGLPIEPGGGSEFLADRNNIASWYAFLNGIPHYDSKARQLGKTQNAVAELNYAFHFGSLSATFLFFSKDFPLAKQNLYRLKCQRDMLPTWMQMRMAYKEDGTIDKGQDSVTTMRNPVTNNVIKVMPRATSMEHAVKLGRGETAAHYWNDEFDFTLWNTEILDAAAPAYNTASENSEKNSSLYGRILTSTPGYLNTKAGKDADDMIKGMVRWDDSFYDEQISKVKGLLSSSKCNGFLYIEHSWKQLGKSLEWYENLCKLVRYDADKILREIELQRIQGNELSPFSKQSLVFIAQNKKTPIEKIDLSKNLQPILIYEKINRKISYILSVDPAEGLGLNNNAFVLINPHTEMIAAEYKSPYISPPDFFRMICKFLKQYCPKTLIVIEANRGRELINRFLESEFRYHIWYDANKITAMKTINTDQYGTEKKAAAQRRAVGFDTTPSNKPLLFSIIERFMQEDLQKVNTEYLVKDVTSVQQKPNGKIILGGYDDGDEGQGHGDVLMSYLIGMYVLYNAKNLEEFGIRRGSSAPIDPDRELTNNEKKLQIQNALGRMPDNVRSLFEDVLRQTDPVDSAMRYERQVQEEIRKINSQNPDNENMFDRELRYMDPEVQQQMWRETQETIFRRQNTYNDPYTNDANGSNQSFNVEDYTSWW